MITWSLLAIAAAAMFQPTRVRAIVAVVYAAALVLHDATLRDADGFLYYASAAGFDLAVLCIVATVRPVPKLAIDVQVLCLASIVANACGFVMWYSYLPPGPYDFAILVINVMAVVALTRRDGGHVGVDTMGGGLFDLPGYCVARCRRILTNKGTA